jgi:hypothetical protein
MFETSVLKHSELMFNDPGAANHEYDTFISALHQLHNMGDDGLSALSKLLDSKNAVIRVSTACYLIHLYTEKALKVLKSAAKEDRGIAMLAMMTLKRWELGRYLDPGSGKEVQLP